MTAYTKNDVLLQAKDISLYYDDKCILRNIDFTVRDIVRPGLQQGQVVSLIGRSGIGKTQLFRVLSGLQKPSGGTITVRERKPVESGNGSIEVWRERPVRAGDMGVIFQNYYQFGWRTVRQSLLLAARKNPALAGKEEDAIREYAGRFDITDVLQRYPAQLSGGQQQRVSIIQQLLKGSNFLLLDEPFSGLDICVLDKVTELLLQVSLSDELKTLIIVSHDIATTVEISDTVFILGKESGKEGSTIIREIDLIERGLAWRHDLRQDKVFVDTLAEIKGCL
ncbi:ATP-binding cassette domain-containing protein [Puia dinghuensis]|uniref:Putative ABC transporter ATP-binding protein YtlC n=1 Tax=Puia dinghuensis TaxID=1792502 RepID=A0A8J2XUJ0_9BACT|nr:ATP-binding cassette domain-containing protein [Puia dinghuensis]GGB13023.1 putative ABC transporter ATP-binding protein YtlC [Puia dinghuensis]